MIGNEKIKLQLSLAGQAAKLKNNSMPHMLFSGSPGTGKTTCAKALADLQDTPYIQAPPESFKNPEAIYGIFTKLDYSGYDGEGNIVEAVRPTIIFFDEIHNLPLIAQEIFGVAMENWEVAVKKKHSPETRLHWLPRFTIIGATTLEGKLSKPFLDRFKMILSFQTYSLEESIRITNFHAARKGYDITEDAAACIASKARGTPRLVVRYLEGVIDATVVLNRNVIEVDTANTIFDLMGIDSTGLLQSDIKLLKALYKAEAPLGVDNLSILLNEEKTTLERRTEPYLIRRGLMIKTGQGRLITERGIDYLQENGHVEKSLGLSFRTQF